MTVLTGFVLLGNGESAGSAEHYQVQEGVGAQSVRTVDAGARRLTTGVQTRNHLIGSVGVSDDLMGEEENTERRTLAKGLQGRICGGVAHLSLIVCGYSPHIVMNSRQDRDGLFGNVDTSKDHGRLRDARKSGGQLLGREVVQLEVHVILVGTDASESVKTGLKKTNKQLKKKNTAKAIHTHLPSLISIVMERDTTSLEARSFALGA